MYSVINPQGDKNSIQCLRRERNQSFAICRTVFIEGLYNRLIRYQNAFRRFEGIGAEMQQDYQSDSVQVKRLAIEPRALPEAKKSLVTRCPLKHMKIHNRCHSCYIRLIFVPGIIFTSFATMPFSVCFWSC